MSETKTSAAKKLTPWLLVVMIAAVVLSVAMVTRTQNLKTEVAGLKTQLDESQAAWQAIDAEKQVKQDELTQVKNALREAQLTLDESLQKAEELGVQIAALKDEKQELTDSAAVYEQLSAYVQDANALIGGMQELLSASDASVQEAQTELEATRSRLLIVQAELTYTQQSMQTIKDDMTKNAEALQAKLDEAQAQLEPLQEQVAEARAAQKDTLIVLQKHYQQALEELKADLASETDESAKEALNARIATLDEQIAALQRQIDAL